MEEAERVSVQVLAETPEQIVSFLIHSAGIFPSYVYLYELVEKRKSENPLEFIIPTAVSDQFGHTSAHYVDEVEKVHLAIMEKIWIFTLELPRSFTLKKLFLMV